MPDNVNGFSLEQITDGDVIEMLEALKISTITTAESAGQFAVPSIV